MKIGFHSHANYRSYQYHLNNTPQLIECCIDIAEVRVHIPFWGPFLESSEKPFVKLRPANSVKLVFSYVVKGIKIKITAKFRASRRLRFEDTKRIMRPKCFGTFEKTGPRP